MRNSVMFLDALQPDDAPEMVRLARETNQDGMRWVYSSGAHGTVVRDGTKIRGFCLIRETAHGFVVDELWCEKSRRGVASLGMLARWIEDTVQRIANERGTKLKLGGIVRNDNWTHRRALENRGFVPVATVLCKEYDPQ